MCVLCVLTFLALPEGRSKIASIVSQTIIFKGTLAKIVGKGFVNEHQIMHI